MVLISSIVYAFAIKNAEVLSENIVASPGDTISIPVILKENPGIMGLNVFLKYDEIFLNPDIKTGELNLNGILSDNITPETNGKFNVIWSGTDVIDSDGILFWVNFKVSDSAQFGEYTVKIDYVPDDTFNERFENVQLICKDITVNIKSNQAVNDGKVTTLTSEYSDCGNGAESTVDFKEIVDEALNELNIGNISDVSEKDAERFIKIVESKSAERGNVIDIDSDNNADKIEKIKELYENDMQETDSESIKENNLILKITVAIATIFLVLILIFLINKFRRKSK